MEIKFKWNKNEIFSCVVKSGLTSKVILKGLNEYGQMNMKKVECCNSQEISNVYKILLRNPFILYYLGSLLFSWLGKWQTGGKNINFSDMFSRSAASF